MKVYIKENSWIAKISAMNLKADKCATVVGSTIHLHNASKDELLTNTNWLRHEVCHVKQWNRKGYLLFLIQYLWFSARVGYYNNPFEFEARQAEGDKEILKNVEIC